MEGTFEFVGVRFFLMPYFAPLICPRCISPSKQFTPHPLSPRNIVCTVFPWYPNQVNITIFDVSETKRGRRTMSLREISPKKGCLAALLLGLGHDKKNRLLPPPFFLVTPLVGVSVLRFFSQHKKLIWKVRKSMTSSKQVRILAQISAGTWLFRRWDAKGAPGASYLENWQVITFERNYLIKCQVGTWNSKPEKIYSNLSMHVHLS